jgi:uncharacterized protein (TIGR04255 family)
VEPLVLPDPFGTEPLEEIHLNQAPLVRVLAQARFEHLSLFMKPDPIAPFIEEISAEYPLLKEGRELQVVVGPTGVSQEPSTNLLWQARSQDSAWTVTISNGSLAVETSQYQSRDDFIARFLRVLRAFADTLGTPPSTRLGIRYTNQINSDNLDPDQLPSLIRADAKGGLAIPVGQNAELKHSITDALFAVGDRFVQGRWGLLPPGTVLDPTLQPLSTKAWILDLDSFTEATDVFVNLQDSKIRGLAEQAYRLFRWLITDEFIERFR